MSESFDEDAFCAQYQAPPRLIYDRQREGLDTVTTVLLDGEMVEFVIPTAVAKAAAAIATKPVTFDPRKANPWEQSA